MKPIVAFLGIIASSCLLFFMGFSFAFTGIAESECPLINGCAALQFHMFLELGLAVAGMVAIMLIYVYGGKKNAKTKVE